MDQVSDFSWLDLREDPTSTQAARERSSLVDPRSARLPSNALQNTYPAPPSGALDHSSIPQPTAPSDLDFEHEMLVWQFSKLTPRTKARVVSSMLKSIEEGCGPVEQKYTPQANSHVETAEPIVDVPIDGLPSDGLSDSRPIRATAGEGPSLALETLQEADFYGPKRAGLEQSVPQPKSPEPPETTAQPFVREPYNPHLSWMSISSGTSSRPYSFASSSARDSIISNRTSMSSFICASPRNSGIAFGQPAGTAPAPATQKERPIACRFAPACKKTFGRVAERNRHEKASCKFNDARESVLCQYCINACDKECQPDCDREHVFKSGRKDKMYAHWRAMHKEQMMDADFECSFINDHLDDD